MRLDKMSKTGDLILIIIFILKGELLQFFSLYFEENINKTYHIQLSSYFIQKTYFSTMDNIYLLRILPLGRELLSFLTK